MKKEFKIGMTVESDTEYFATESEYHIYAKDLGEKIEGCYFIDNLRDGETEKEYHDRNFDEITDYLKENAKEGDLIITLGCGDVYKIAKKLRDLI